MYKRKKYSFNERYRYHLEKVNREDIRLEEKVYSLGFVYNNSDKETRKIWLDLFSANKEEKEAYLAGEKAAKKALDKALSLKQ